MDGLIVAALILGCLPLFLVVIILVYKGLCQYVRFLRWIAWRLL